MKNIAVLLLIVISGCSTPKYAIAKEECNDGGSYTLEIQENKSLTIKDDSAGKVYYSLNDTPGNSVAIYKYTRAKTGDYQDNFYNEEVIFEFTGKKISTEAINKSTMLFGVQCYCKGKAGYYKINSPVIKQEDNSITLDIHAIIDNQIIDSVYIKSL